MDGNNTGGQEGQQPPVDPWLDNVREHWSGDNAEFAIDDTFFEYFPQIEPAQSYASEPAPFHDPSNIFDTSFLTQPQPPQISAMHRSHSVATSNPVNFNVDPSWLHTPQDFHTELLNQSQNTEFATSEQPASSGLPSTQSQMDTFLQEFQPSAQSQMQFPSQLMSSPPAQSMTQQPAQLMGLPTMQPTQNIGQFPDQQFGSTMGRSFSSSYPRQQYGDFFSSPRPQHSPPGQRFQHMTNQGLQSLQSNDLSMRPLSLELQHASPQSWELPNTSQSQTQQQEGVQMETPARGRQSGPQYGDELGSPPRQTHSESLTTSGQYYPLPYRSRGLQFWPPARSAELHSGSLFAQGLNRPGLSGADPSIPEDDDFSELLLSSPQVPRASDNNLEPFPSLGPAILGGHSNAQASPLQRAQQTQDWDSEIFTSPTQAAIWNSMTAIPEGAELVTNALPGYMNDSFAPFPATQSGGSGLRMPWETPARPRLSELEQMEQRTEQRERQRRELSRRKKPLSPRLTEPVLSAPSAPAPILEPPPPPQARRMTISAADAQPPEPVDEFHQDLERVAQFIPRYMHIPPPGEQTVAPREILRAFPGLDLYWWRGSLGNHPFVLKESTVGFLCGKGASGVNKTETNAKHLVQVFDGSRERADRYLAERRRTKEKGRVGSMPWPAGYTPPCCVPGPLSEAQAARVEAEFRDNARLWETECTADRSACPGRSADGPWGSARYVGETGTPPPRSSSGKRKSMSEVQDAQAKRGRSQTVSVPGASSGYVTALPGRASVSERRGLAARQRLHSGSNLGVATPAGPSSSQQSVAPVPSTSVQMPAPTQAGGQQQTPQQQGEGQEDTRSEAQRRFDSWAYEYHKW